MCITYTCPACQTFDITYCKLADRGYALVHCDTPAYDPDPESRSRKCRPCVVVESAIHKLQELVWLYPWLSTEGLSGAESRPEWDYTMLNRGRNEESDLDSDHGDHGELRERLKAMQLDNLDGKEHLNDGHGLSSMEGDKRTEDVANASHDITTEEQRSSWDSGQGTLTSEADNIVSDEQKLREVESEEVPSGMRVPSD